jgi:GNAT superfamily N-acetyltransferase
MTGATAPSDPAISRLGAGGLGAGELDGAQALVAEAGWNQLSADWRIFLDLGTVYAVRGAAGRLVATAATLPYGDRFAWISMVLVAGDHRRRGLATRLLHCCLDDLVAKNLVPVLDATPAGRPIYRALGFADAWGFHRWARREPRRSDGSLDGDDIAVEPITDAAWPALVRYDTRVFGTERSALLSRLRGRLAAAARCVRRHGEVVGFLFGRDGRSASHLGPLIAEDGAVAKALLSQALATIGGPIYIDLADTRPDIAAWLSARGFAAQRPFTRMLHRRHACFDDTARTFAVVGPEFG